MPYLKYDLLFDCVRILSKCDLQSKVFLIESRRMGKK